MAEENSSFEVDLSNLQLADDEPIEGLDVDAEFNAPFSPLDDGEHQLRLAISERKPKINGTTRDGKTNYWIAISGTCVDPGTSNDGKFADDMISTQVMESGACKAAEFLIKAAGVDKSEVRSMSKGKMIARAFEFVSGNPIVKAETRWEARGKEKGDKTILRGQKRFPKDAKGNPVPLKEDPKTGGEVYTRAQIVRYVG